MSVQRAASSPLLAAQRGLLAGLRTTGELARVIIPVYVAVRLLSLTPLIDWLSGQVAPIMAFMGLPEEVAIALVVGQVSNMYTPVAIVAALGLSPEEITVVGLALGISHNLLVEAAVIGKMGGSAAASVLLRLSLALLGAIVLSRLLG